jgi:phosphatidate phosphatase PAH1
MERNYDEVISDMLIQLVRIEQSLEKENTRMEAFDKRMDLAIKRMVKAESRLEASEKRMELFDKRMELFDQKLEQSITEQREFSKVQSELNRYFLNAVGRNGKNGK